MSILVTVKFGIGNSVEREFDDDTTISQVINNEPLKAYLGYTDNVDAFVNGVKMSGSDKVFDKDVIKLQTKSNTKALL